MTWLEFNEKGSSIILLLLDALRTLNFIADTVKFLHNSRFSAYYAYKMMACCALKNSIEVASALEATVFVNCFIFLLIWLIIVAENFVFIL